MDENIYSLIFLLLFVVLLVTGWRKHVGSSTGKGSELHATDRYAVAEQCLAG